MTRHREDGLRKWGKGGCDKPGAEGLGPSRMRVSFPLTLTGVPLCSPPCLAGVAGQRAAADKFC